MSGKVALQFGYGVRHNPVPHVKLGLAEISGSCCFVAVSSFLVCACPKGFPNMKQIVAHTLFSKVCHFLI
jgi:hypothetical protein